MQEGQALAPYFGSVWGVGEGRGVALMISFVGLVSLLVVFICWLIPSIRRVDIDVPDFDEEDEKLLQNNHIERA